MCFSSFAMPELAAVADAEVEALVDPAPSRASKRVPTWMVSALSITLFLAGFVALCEFSGHPSGLRGALDKALGFSDGTFACGRMRCTPGSICCGGTECCSAGSDCCGGTCLAPGGICCRNRTEAPLLCTPGSDCCGKDTDTAQCCSTGCANGPFIACKLQT